jgi:hypothetical protein
MSNELEPAVQVLQRKLEEQQKAVSETKKTINMLMKMMGEEPPYREDEDQPSGIIRPDQYYGKGLATAAQEYLAMRKQACQPEDILRGMLAGGFDFDVIGWREADRLRSLAMSLAKNVAKFHRLKNGSFGLRSWYDEDFLKRAAARKATAAMNGTAQMSPEEEQEAADNFVPKVGDWVQWEPNGVMQFTEPQQITRISEDGTFAFVDLSPTGMPVEELALQPRPTRTRKTSTK